MLFPNSRGNKAAANLCLYTHTHTHTHTFCTRPAGTHLHCGDCRFHPRFLSYPALRAAGGPPRAARGARTHTHTHTHAHMHTLTRTRTRTRMCAHTHTQRTCARARAHARLQTHTITHERTRTRTHTPESQRRAYIARARRGTGARARPNSICATPCVSWTAAAQNIYSLYILYCGPALETLFPDTANARCQ